MEERIDGSTPSRLPWNWPWRARIASGTLQERSKQLHNEALAFLCDFFFFILHVQPITSLGFLRELSGRPQHVRRATELHLYWLPWCKTAWPTPSPYCYLLSLRSDLIKGLNDVRIIFLHSVRKGSSQLVAAGLESMSSESPVLNAGHSSTLVMLAFLTYSYYFHVLMVYERSALSKISCLGRLATDTKSVKNKWTKAVTD